MIQTNKQSQERLEAVPTSFRELAQAKFCEIDSKVLNLKKKSQKKFAKSPEFPPEKSGPGLSGIPGIPGSRDLRLMKIPGFLKMKSRDFSGFCAD